MAEKMFTFEFDGEIVEWRGPSPFLFVPMLPEHAAELKDASKRLTFGWGCLSAVVTVGKSSSKTMLYPRNGTYFVPIKVAIQRAEKVDLGDIVRVRVDL